MEIRMQDSDRSISVRLFADLSLIPLAQGVVENAALAFGMDRKRVLRLAMAAEEIVSYLAETASDEELKMTVSPGGWCVEIDFSFVADPSDLWIINLAAQKRVRSGESVEHLGLLLASRMMDGFTVKVEGKYVHLVLRLDYEYPAITPEPAARGEATGPYTVVDDPESALVKEACASVVNLYPPHLVHTAFRTPGKVVDMLASGVIDMIVALDSQGRLAGMLGWRSPSPSSISFSGPYVFAGDGEVAEALEMHLFMRVARSKAQSLFSDLATPELICANFEKLGPVCFQWDDEECTNLDVWFRHLQEDSGTAVWAHPDMVEFLQSAYERLSLMRTVREVDAAGEMLPGKSVFSARLRKELKEAVLLPMVVGSDAAESVARQVGALLEDGYRNIFFYLDLACGWQAAMGGALMEKGFMPRLLLPHGGNSDMVVFQYA